MERVSVHKAKPVPSASGNAPSWLAAPQRSGVLQRKCGCSGSGSAFGKCEECKAERGAPLQRASAGRAEPATAPPIVHEVLRSPGQPLDAATRAYMEPRFGYDFSKVRVHADANAAESARAVNALAYTAGRNLVFGAGQYLPRTEAGTRLLAHELAHVLQQGTKIQSRDLEGGPQADRLEREADTAAEHAMAGRKVWLPQRPGSPQLQRKLATAGADAPIRGALTEQPQEQAFPDADPSKQTLGATDASIDDPLPPDASEAPTAAHFVTPTPQPEDPLARILAGLTPGLTQPTINGLSMLTSNLLDYIRPKGLAPVEGTQVTAGLVACQAPRNFSFSISADVVVASEAGPLGWQGTSPTDTIGGAKVSGCAGHKNIPVTMNAQPNNAAFVSRVRAGEQEHVNEIKLLHDRYLVPYGTFLMNLQASGANIKEAVDNFTAQANPRVTQAGLGFSYGYKAATAKLDDPRRGTHKDNIGASAAPGCKAIDLVSTPPKHEVGTVAPGNVVTIKPSVVTFNPVTLRVEDKTIKDGSKAIKTFSTSQVAQRALQVIQHYQMTSRCSIGPMEYFLAGDAAPNGELEGANEVAIDPDLYQVSRGVPAAPNDWTIAQVVGNNAEILVNFMGKRDTAYSAYDILNQHRFTYLCWVGGTRQKPEMLYFRT